MNHGILSSYLLLWGIYSVAAARHRPPKILALVATARHRPPKILAQNPTNLSKSVLPPYEASKRTSINASKPRLLEVGGRGGSLFNIYIYIYIYIYYIYVHIYIYIYIHILYCIYIYIYMYQYTCRLIVFLHSCHRPQLSFNSCQSTSITV